MGPNIIQKLINYVQLKTLKKKLDKLKFQISVSEEILKWSLLHWRTDKGTQISHLIRLLGFFFLLNFVPHSYILLNFYTFSLQIIESQFSRTWFSKLWKIVLYERTYVSSVKPRISWKLELLLLLFFFFWSFCLF